jgi:putative colanic acid biosynthesis UDP-glucose lipid carrier transferase
LAAKHSRPGPIFYKQRRNGISGESIQIFKFRTMKLREEAEGQIRQASKDDERITAVRRFLRRLSLDELPQPLNVVRGELSLTGPRPHAVEHSELYRSCVPRYMMRHKVKPGLDLKILLMTPFVLVHRNAY